MLPKFMMSPFKVEEAQPEKLNKKKKKLTDQKRNSTSSSCFSSSDDDGGGRRTTTDDHETPRDVIGLRLVTQITNSKTKSNNVVVKSSLIRKPNLTITCFLKTCSLCNKILSPDKDIYMYRGDQGFCSIECRNRQIAMDEMRELEEFTKQRTTSSSSPRNCWNDARLRHETRLILEDIRLHRLQSKPIPSSHHRNHWAIVS